MFDTHYDLLTIAYQAYVTGDYTYLENISKFFHENNVNGVIANLYFMSREEMIRELGKDYYQDDVSVLEMFKKAKEVVDTYLPDIKIIYSIEGADYITGINELEELYNEGLDALILCWNTESKYGSGNRSDKGLTDEGKKLLNKAIDLGIGIDLSHANKKTFYDMVDLIKKRQENGDDVCCYASHSNVRSLCSRDRNLDTDQIKAIRDIGGLVGVFSCKNFIVKKDDISDKVDFRKEYLNHIAYVMAILGSTNVMVATDDMNFLVDNCPEYSDLNIYNYRSIGKDLTSDLVEKFGFKASLRIMYENVDNKIYLKLKNNKSRGVK